MVVGGKTGTGDHRYEVYGSGGQLIKSTVMNRSATFVFYIGDRYYGTLIAFVPGLEAEKYHFTSGLPVQILKTLAPDLAPYLRQSLVTPSCTEKQIEPQAEPQAEPQHC